tara:strand:- start:669 stop:794 length:126 start_codon:yes stop_codon:yes gene_type:complete
MLECVIVAIKPDRALMLRNSPVRRFVGLVLPLREIPHLFER